jgi:hypothetical protein
MYIYRITQNPPYLYIPVKTQNVDIFRQTCAMCKIATEIMFK